MQTARINSQKLALLGMLTAIVAVMQWLASVLPIFPFTLTLVLIPIVIGAALCGTAAGAWLGFVFSFVVLVAGQATPFMVISIPGTLIIVIFKGTLCGLCAALVYKMLAGKNKTSAVIAAAVVCPVINTGIFIIGSYIFFLPAITMWGEGAGFDNVTSYIFLGLVGINFPLELAFNLVLSPVIVRLIQLRQDKRLTV
ncbi:MAG: ECF transporter S component [Oscillospiraceae bacterium]|nr:ECF transporter S component [Oscillospiraceae bacterium]